MLKFKRLFRGQFNLLLGLLSMALVVVFTACAQSTPTPFESTPTPLEPPPISAPAQPTPISSNTSDAVAMPTEFRIGYQIIPNAELLTKGLGLMEEKYPDIDIKWMGFKSGGDVTTAMVTGAIDVALAGSVPASMGIAQNLPYQVYFIHDIIGDNEALVVKEDSGINSLGDLPGKTVAAPFRSTTHYSLLSALKQEGIGLDDLQVLDMQPQEMLAAWRRGDIDGGFVWHPTLAQMTESNGKTLVTAKQLAETGIITADLGIVNKDFAAQYPDFLAKYVKVLDNAVQIYRNDPKTASEAMSDEVNLSPEESSKVMSELVWLSAEEQASEKYLGTPEAPGALGEVLKDSADFMVEQGAMPSAPDLEVYRGAVFNKAVAEAALSPFPGEESTNCP